MKIASIICHVVILSIFYGGGVAIQRWLDLPIPGSIIGMLLLFLALLSKVLPVRFIEEGSALLLKHMPLLFLPVTVGILQFLDVFAGSGILLILITLISTIMVMMISSLIGQKLIKRKEVEKKL
ncbi:CidA/LrgA family protein [Halalkalibacter krulwichiae]|uniref:CidA/LrgA family protein n=1 Tax=Halalkalibacter krulwichiae TaxID=199441 RepID=UPI0008253223|nr:CidA/LrgA family protein [Halalkalibacter krulwichiae]